MRPRGRGRHERVAASKRRSLLGCWSRRAALQPEEPVLEARFAALRLLARDARVSHFRGVGL